jgi:hypothetical protein
MPNPWMPGLRHDPGRGAGYAAGRNQMRMPVWHSTGGTNSYDVCKNGRPGYRTGLCQILLPKVGTPWQFTEIDAICYHAGSSTYGDYNDDGPGFELERFQDEPPTADQTSWIGRIVAFLRDEWGVPDAHYWGPRFPAHGANFRGHVNHSDIHPNPDGLSREEWDRITSGDEVTPEDIDKISDMTRDKVVAWLNLAGTAPGLKSVGDTWKESLDVERKNFNSLDEIKKKLEI